MATSTKSKSKGKITSRPAGRAARSAEQSRSQAAGKGKGKAKVKAKPAARAKAPAKPSARGKGAAARPGKTGRAKPKARAGSTRPAGRARPARTNAAATEKARLSPRVTAALKAATWAADWVTAQGRFVWHDLMTTDPQAARAFYGALFGWTVEELGMDGVTVLLLRNGEQTIGTIMAETSLPASHWLPYLAVADVDRSCRRAGEMGGRVSGAATNVPRLGRFSVLDDPQGAAFSVLRRPSDAGPPPDPNRVGPGDFCWEELHTSDPEAAARFYADVFGWSIESTPMEFPYWIAKNGDQMVAGFMRQPPEAPQRPAWLSYVAVADVDASAAQAVSLGGIVLVPPSDIPEMGRFAVLADPGGASFALFQAAAQRTG
jgi:predicted enzyme related to lactoylglutathione lyase